MVVDGCGEAKELLHAVGKLGDPTQLLLHNGRSIFYLSVVSLDPETLHFMGCDSERNEVNERSLTSSPPSIFNEFHDVGDIDRKFLLHHT
jgi:hypothetical protein